MRKTADIDRLLENAVAIALGLAEPHPALPAAIRPDRRRALSRRRGVSLPRREPRKAA